MSERADVGVEPGFAGIEYLHGFGNEHHSEAVPGVLPWGQNSPQRVAYGLYAEQHSATAFTEPREINRRTWTYRIMPSAAHGPFERIDDAGWVSAPTPGECSPRTGCVGIRSRNRHRARTSSTA